MVLLSSASVATYTIRYVQSTVGKVDNRTNDSRHSETHVNHVHHYDRSRLTCMVL